MQGEQESSASMLLLFFYFINMQHGTHIERVKIDWDRSPFIVVAVAVVALVCSVQSVLPCVIVLSFSLSNDRFDCSFC